MTRDELTLRTAQVKWVEGKNDNKWDLATPSNESLILLSSYLTKDEIAELLLFIQKHEMAAYEAGIEMGKQAMLAANRQRMTEMSNDNLVLRNMNEDLANKIEAIIEREI